MDHMTPTRIITIVLILVALGIAAKYLYRPTPRQIAYDICYDGGMSVEAVDELIEQFTGATEGREKLIELYTTTFTKDQPINCVDCANSILDAAGVAK